MIWKYLEQNVLLPKDLNWVQHWVSRIGLLNLVNYLDNNDIDEAYKISLPSGWQFIFYDSFTSIFTSNSKLLSSGSFQDLRRGWECQGNTAVSVIRAVFKWLSKVIMWLRLLCLVIGLKESRQFFNHWEAKPIAPCTRDFSRALSELQVIARKCDWFIALSAPVVIGRSNCFSFGFSTVIWKPL